MISPVESVSLSWTEEFAPEYDLVCLSHLRWNFVYQRPQHLLSRCAKERRVFFIEEPIFDAERAHLHLSHPQKGLWIVVPHLPQELYTEIADTLQSCMLDGLFTDYHISKYVLWYYTPMALSFTRHLEPLAIVYDCMDELSAFRFAPETMKQREAELLDRADLVFTGGQSLYQAKRQQHSHVYAFPSSVDAAYFAQARTRMGDPADQAAIPHPRLGFYGVIDERIDLDLLAALADAQRDWQLVLLGPTAKIDPDTLPKRTNIHYLGSKSYVDLPTYLAGWDVAIMPFAHNESTRFISPTKTLEYLAGGKPVVSTSIHDVVYPYGQQGLISIADTADEFIAAVKEVMEEESTARRSNVDLFLSRTSWDATWGSMRQLIASVVVSRGDELLRLVNSSLAARSSLSADASILGGHA